MFRMLTNYFMTKYKQKPINDLSHIMTEAPQIITHDYYEFIYQYITLFFNTQNIYQKKYP